MCELLDNLYWYLSKTSNSIFIFSIISLFSDNSFADSGFISIGISFSLSSGSNSEIFSHSLLAFFILSSLSACFSAFSNSTVFLFILSATSFLFFAIAWFISISSLKLVSSVPFSINCAVSCSDDCNKPIIFSVNILYSSESSNILSFAIIIFI